MEDKEQKTIVKDSSGIIIGDDNEQNLINLPQKEESFDIPMDDWLNRIVLISRWLWEKIGPRGFFFAIISVMIISTGMIYYVVSKFNGGLQTIPISLLLIGGLGIFLLSISITIIRLYKTRTCNNENCRRHFAYREHKPLKHMRKGNYKGTIYHNLKQFLKCDYCGQEFEYEYIDSEPIKK